MFTSELYLIGFHPCWNATFKFTVKVPQLAVVSFRVLDYENMTSNVLIAHNSLRFDSLKTGG